MDQPLCGVRIFRALWNRRREDCHLLRAVGKRSDDGDAGHRLELADLLEPDLDVAASKRVADAFVRFDDFALRLDLIRDPEPWKENGPKIHAARAVGRPDRLRL